MTFIIYNVCPFGEQAHITRKIIIHWRDYRLASCNNP